MANTVRNAVEDRPALVDVVLCLLVAAQAGLSRHFPPLSVPHLFEHVDAADLAGLFSTVAGLAAILAGFAGVVAVFGLQAPGRRFRRMRIAGGTALRAVWLGTITSALAAAFTAVTGAVVASLEAGWAPWLLELALLFCAQAAVQQVWVFQRLADVVTASDKEEEDVERVIPSEERRRPPSLR